MLGFRIQENLGSDPKSSHTNPLSPKPKVQGLRVSDSGFKASRVQDSCHESSES